MNGWPVPLDMLPAGKPCIVICAYGHTPHQKRYTVDGQPWPCHAFRKQFDYNVKAEYGRDRTARDRNQSDGAPSWEPLDDERAHRCLLTCVFVSGILFISVYGRDVCSHAPPADLPDCLVRIATTQVHRQGDPVHRCEWQNSAEPCIEEQLLECHV